MHEGVRRGVMGNNNLRGSLELNWINKDKALLYEIDEKESKGIRPIWVEKDDIRVSEPRNLKLVEEFGDSNNENILIKGDNLLALKTLARDFKNREEKDKVKCIYIDPPFNTGKAFENYDDNLEHSQWLTMMRDRLVKLKRLLRKDGAIFLHLNESEIHYGKVLMDEIFGRSNYLTTIIVQMRHPGRILLADKDVHDIMDYVLFYCRDREYFKPKKGIRDISNIDVYIYAVNEIRKPKIKKIGGKQVQIFGPGGYEIIRKKKPSKKNLRKENIRSSIIDRNSTTRFYRDHLKRRLNMDGHGALYKVPGIGADGLGYRYIVQPQKGYKNANYFQGYPLEKKDFEEVPLANFIDVSSKMASGSLAEEGGVRLPKGKKTEHLIKPLIEWANCSEGDIVLDSFAGSGTTGAVAHKMGYRWIMVEIGQHAETLCISRLKRVISGRDQTGISTQVGWKGGAGFRYYVVGDSLIRGSDINWELTYEEIARALFRMFDYSFVGKLEDEIYVGRRKAKYSLSIASKDLDIIKDEGLVKIIGAVKARHKNMAELEIYTNKGVGVREEDLPEAVSIKKIPESVLRKYKL